RSVVPQDVLSFTTRRSSDLGSRVQSGYCYSYCCCACDGADHGVGNGQGPGSTRNFRERVIIYLSVWFCDGSILALLLPCFTGRRSEEHTSELQSRFDLVCRL